MTIEQVDRGIFELIRKKLVLLSLWPDIRLQADAAAMTAAIAALRASQGTLVEPFSISSPKKRGASSDAKIVVDRSSPRPGSLGAAGHRFQAVTVQNVQTYDKYKHPESSFDVEYEIRYICSETNITRILDQMLMELFGARGFFNPIAPDGSIITDEVFFMESMGTSGGLGVTPDGTDERMFRYLVRDAWLTPEKLIASAVPRLLEVIPQIEAKKINEI